MGVYSANSKNLARCKLLTLNHKQLNSIRVAHVSSFVHG